MIRGKSFKELIMKKYSIIALIWYSANIGTNGQTFHNYLWANYEQFDQQFTQAQHYYEPVLQSNPSLYAYKGYLHYLQETNQWVKVVALIEKLDSTFATDIDIQMIFAQALEQIGNQNGCDERIIRLNNTCKNNQEIVFSAAQIYIRRKEPENALKVIETYLNSSADKTNNFIFYFVKSQILVQMDKKNEALVSVKKSLELYPKFDKSWLLMAILEEQAGRIASAVAGYNHFLQETSDSKSLVQEHLTQLVMQYKLTHLLQPSSDSGFDHARKLMEQKEFEKALTAINSCLEKDAANQEYCIFKIDALASLKRFGQAATLLKNWIMAQPHHDLWYQTLHLLGKRGLNAQELIAIFKEIEKKHKDAPLPTLYLADLYIRTNSSHAMSYLKRAAAATTDNAVKTKILYQMALLHYDKRQLSDLKKTLLSIYELNKDFLPGLNLLAYYYASKENNLPHAFMLIEQVVMKDPTNPHYLDTKAFILYKQKNYAQARSLLEQCTKLAPQDAIIKRHLVKTMYQMGEIQQAKELLKQALGAPGHNEQENKKLVTLSQRWNNGRNK